MLPFYVIGTNVEIVRKYDPQFDLNILWRRSQADV